MFAVFGREAYAGLEQEARLSSDQLEKIKTTKQLFTLLGMLDQAKEEEEKEVSDAIDVAVQTLRMKMKNLSLNLKKLMTREHCVGEQRISRKRGKLLQRVRINRLIKC